MKINLTPMRSDSRFSVSLAGMQLRIGDSFIDLGSVTAETPMPCHMTGCDWIVSDITMEEGEISVTLIFPHGADAPEEMRFPVRVL